MDTLRITLLNEDILLMASRTLYWERTRTLIAAQLLLSADTSLSDNRLATARLSHAISATNPARIIMLGDWFCEGTDEGALIHLNTMMPQLAACKLHQVGGTPSPLHKLCNITVMPSPTRGPNFVLSDLPTPAPIGYTLAPQHRAWVEHDTAYACFCVTNTLATLPALAEQPYAALPFSTSDGTLYALMGHDHDTLVTLHDS